MNILNSLSSRWRALAALLLGIVSLATAVDYDEPPINYSSAPVQDPVTALISKIADGTVQLQWDDQFGWLPSLLAALNISQSSQVLVYSKTSLQRERISPETPRALYFNDETYVGMVQYGDVLEISSTDPQQGTTFYILSQRRDPDDKHARVIERQTHECLQCHDSTSFTGGVPGLVVRSVYTSASGRPVLTAGSHITDQRSPWGKRWGGWYVTGTYGANEHMGNVIFPTDVTPETADLSQSFTHVTLEKLINTKPYLNAHSDVVALMVLVHQTQMHNLLTRASYEARKALRDDTVMNEVLERPVNYRSDTAKRRIAHVGEALLRHLLFVDEAPLPDPVTGSSSYAQEFQALGLRDKQGRSLRDLDLQKRLLRYPCSYLIYSPSFDALPPAVRTFILERLLQVLSGADQSPAYVHIIPADRRAILEILVATKPNLPDSYAQALNAAVVSP